MPGIIFALHLDGNGAPLGSIVQVTKPVTDLGYLGFYPAVASDGGRNFLLAAGGHLGKCGAHLRPISWTHVQQRQKNGRNRLAPFVAAQKRGQLAPVPGGRNAHLAFRAERENNRQRHRKTCGPFQRGEAP